MILIDHRDAQVMDFPAKGVSQDHQLHDGHDHRYQDERGAAHKLAQVAFHQCPDSIHDVLPLHLRIKEWGYRILQGVAQLPAGVMHEYIVERGALNGK